MCLLATVLPLSGGPALAAAMPAPAEPVSAAPGLDQAPTPATIRPAPAATGPVAPADASEPPVAFEADRIDYDDKAETLTASGNVFLKRDDQSVRADSVEWDRKTGKIIARGNVRAVDENGNETLTDHVEMTDELKTGAMQDLLILLRDGGRVAASGGTRDAEGQIHLDRTAYTSCDVVDDTGCPRKPSWRITARRVVFSPERHRLRLYGARLTLFGIVPLPLPQATVATDGSALWGLLIPDFKTSSANGLEFSDTYYMRLAENRDLAVTGYAFTKVQPMASLQYRALTGAGAYQVTGYVTRSPVIPQSATTGNDQWRGYIEGNGHFQLSPAWDIGFSGRLESDRTFLSRYMISNDDTLRSTVDVQHITTNSYLSIAGWAFQTLRPGRSEGQVPIALPEIDYRLRLADPLLGGALQLQANSLAITRSAGQDVQRAFTSAQWDLSRYTPWGQRVTFTGLLRGDIYHSTNNALTTTTIYQGADGWQGRAVAVGAVDVTWPLIGQILGGTQVLTPHVQVVAVPPTRNLALPNQDARAIELEDDNLFSLNRFPGYDRIEDGTRFTYGVDWQLDRPSWGINATIGQSYRLTSSPTLLPVGTGLSDRQSDIVGRTELRYRDLFKITHRYRLDKSNFAFRRNEIDATVGSDQSYLEVGYSRLNRNIAAALEDLQDSDELRAAARVAMARYWSVFGSGIFDLSRSNLVPGTTNSAFQPLRTRLGVSYQSDCFEFDLTWRRDYITIGDATKGSSFQIHIALKNLGLR